MKNKVTFFGDKGWIFLCSIVLAAVGGLAFVACDDGSTDPDEPGPKVTLAAGSQGIAGDKTITGLTTGKPYLVKTNDKWQKVKTDGTLDTAFTPLKADDVGTPPNLSGTAIKGLTNGQTYDVYIYFKPNGTTNFGGAETKKKNALIDLSAYTNGNPTGTMTSLAAGSDKTTLVFLMGDDQGIVSGSVFTNAPLASQVVNSNSSGLKYTFTTANAGGAVLTTVEGNLFFTVSKISSTTSITKILTNTGT